MKLPKPLSRMSLKSLRQFKSDLLAALDGGFLSGYTVYVSSKQLAPGEYGEFDSVNKEITISANKGLLDTVDTIIHESLHKLLPNRSESYIHRLSMAVSKQLTSTDKDRILARFAELAIWDD